MDMLKFVADFLVAKFPILGTIGANALAIAFAVNVLIEAVEVVVALTPSKKDDDMAAKVKGMLAKAIPYIEYLPHTNVPIAPVVLAVTKMVGKIAKAIIGAVKGFTS